MKIKNAIVLVTGANRGLGRAVVEASLLAGAQRVYASARDPRSLHELVQRSEGRVVGLELDVTNAASLARAAEMAPDVTLLVNNAGVLASFGLLTSETSAIAQDLAINFYGVLATTKAFLPTLERSATRGEAALVNVLSVVALANLPALGGYSASKAAAASVTQGLRVDLRARGIGVHGVFAGAIDTDMTKGMDMAKTSPGDVARAILEGVEHGEEDIFPDAMSRQISAIWRDNPKQVERQLGGSAG
jgi:NAD(P)-dependent dehydrogenase (short-subunit alcohol dehydrogenase family)